MTALLVALLALLGAVQPAASEDSDAARKRSEKIPAEGTPLARDVTVFGGAKALLGVHTHWEPLPSAAPIENIVSLRGRANLGIDWKASESLRVFVEGRALWRGSAEHDFERAKAYFEPQLGEAFVDLYTRSVDFRLGNQIIAFGANPTFAPSDRINPRDFRESFLFSEPEEFKLPVFAARARGTVGRFDWTAVYAPFFSADRYTVFGQDEAFIQPTLGLPIPIQLDPSVEDQLQPSLFETEKPNAFPYLGDVGIRLGTDLVGIKVGLSWVWFNEKLPALTLDPQLAAFLGQVTNGQAADPVAALVLQSRFLSGERLFVGRFPRQHIFSAELSWLLGSSEVDVDLAYSPAQTFYDATFQSLRKPAITWVLGINQASDSPFFYSFTYWGVAVSSLQAGERLFLFESASAGDSSRTALLHLFIGNVTYAFFHRKLQIGLRAAFEPMRSSFVAGPRATYRITERWTALLGAELFRGSSRTPFGYFGRNEQVVAGVRAEIF